MTESQEYLLQRNCGGLKTKRTKEANIEEIKNAADFYCSDVKDVTGEESDPESSFIAGVYWALLNYTKE